MLVYLVRRLLAMLPTLFGITLASFVIINLAPGSPVEQRLQAIRMGGAMGGSGGRGESGVSKEVVEALKRQYGLDKPLHVRYAIWIKNIATLDFGQSFTYEEPVVDVILGKMPVSLSFGIASLFLTYLVSIPIGVAKAIGNGSRFDVVSSFLLFIMLSIVPVMLAVLCIVFLAGGSYLSWFPIGGLTSDAYDSLGLGGKILDRAQHFALPLLCYTVGQFTFLTIMMKNSMLDVIQLDYVRTARAKGLAEKVVYMKHAMRNALIPIVTGLSGILSVFFAGSIILESVFQLDGMGKLSLQAISSRDYNLLMGLIFLESLMFLAGRLAVDFLYVAVDPRIDFA
jgi:microcin C transport system permease protein